MQTSFMHPPFGFALFYLRSVAPAKAYTDRLTRKLIQPVTTMQIYWGAVPFVLIQIIMVGLIIFFPAIVSSGLDKKEVFDMQKIQQQMEKEVNQDQSFGAPQPDNSGFGAPQAEPGFPPPNDDPLKDLQQAAPPAPAK